MPFSIPGGYDLLATRKLTAAATTLGAISIPACDMLMLQVSVTSYASNDIVSLRFNADSGNNYVSRYLTAAGTVATFTNTANQSATLARLFSTGITGARSNTVAINNPAGAVKLGAVSSATGPTGTFIATTALTIDLGSFAWVNTANQITSIEVLTAGATNLGVGSGIAIFGLNL